MKIDHWEHVSLLIRNQIDISEGKFDEEDELDGHTGKELERLGSGSSIQFRNIVLGAKQKPIKSFLEIEVAHGEDPAFRGFRKRFRKFLSMHPEATLNIYGLSITQDTTVSYIILIIRTLIKIVYRFRSSDTSKSHMNPKSPGKQILIISGAVPISKRSHDTIA